MKLSKFLQITEIINQVLKPSKVQKQTIMNIQHCQCPLYYVYGNETCILKEQHKARITATDIFFRKTAKYTYCMTT
jgi:hypothetical protein